jgi:hypothetical protein
MTFGQELPTPIVKTNGDNAKLDGRHFLFTTDRVLSDSAAKDYIDKFFPKVSMACCVQVCSTDDGRWLPC